MVVVANKHDLPDDKHLVNSDEIEALAVIDWNNGFVRASAALNWNIDEIFQQVLIQARQPPTLAEAIVSKRCKSLPPKLPHP
jgi:translation elongation factor EF-4